MTGIPRLQHLPVPVATTGATAVALPESGRQAKAVVPVTPVHPRQAQAERSTAWSGGAAREGAEDAGDLKRGHKAAADGRASGETTVGRLAGFSRLSSMPFMVQVLGQQAAAGRSQVPPQTSLSGHRDAALLGSDRSEEHTSELQSIMRTS